MKVNRLVYFFQYYPTNNYKSYLGMLFGLTGALIGLYIWWDSFLQHSGIGEYDVKVELSLFLFIPCIVALLAVICQKTYLMWVASLLSFPIFYKLFVRDDNIPYLDYLPVIFFIASSLFMYTTTLRRKDKEELAQIISEEVKRIEKEVFRWWSEITFEENPLLNKELTTFGLASMYQHNIRYAKEIKRNYEKYVKSRGQPFANTYRLGVFYYITRSYGVWDLKRIIGDTTMYTFQGKEKSGEYIGNHHFGYMGAAAGFSCKVLRISAGMYQVYSGTSNWRYLFSFFDNPEDSNAIADGCSDYDNGYKF